jgi:hypothetical protein
MAGRRDLYPRRPPHKSVITRRHDRTGWGKVLAVDHIEEPRPVAHPITPL